MCVFLGPWGFGWWLLVFVPLGLSRGGSGGAVMQQRWASELSRATALGRGAPRSAPYEAPCSRNGQTSQNCRGRDEGPRDRSRGWPGAACDAKPLALGLSVPRTTCDIWGVLDTAQWQPEPLRHAQTHRQADVPGQTVAGAQNSPSSLELLTGGPGGSAFRHLPNFRERRCHLGVSGMGTEGLHF